MIDQTAVADLEPGTLLYLSSETSLWGTIDDDGFHHDLRVVVPAKECVMVLANVHKALKATPGNPRPAGVALLLYRNQVGWVTHATASQRFSRW